MNEPGTGCWSCGRPTHSVVRMHATFVGLVCDMCVSAALCYIVNSAASLCDIEAIIARKKIAAQHSLERAREYSDPPAPHVVAAVRARGRGRVRRAA